MNIRKGMRAILTALTLLLIAAPAWAQDLGTLDGTWEGNLTPINSPGLFVRQEPYSLRIVVSEETVRVFHSEKGGPFKEIKPGQFHITKLKTNAVFFAIDSGTDTEGTWVQSITYSVTLKDPGTLIVNWYSVVNNNNLPLSNAYSKFTAAATGELLRQP